MIESAEALRRAEACVPDFLKLLGALVEHESPSGDAPRNRAVADLLQTELERVGASVERHAADGYGDHLVAHVPGETRPGTGPLLLVGHMDTVHPVGTLERFPFRVDGDRVRGPGAYDMKGGLAACLQALRLLADQKKRPRSELRLIVTCDEEVGSPTSRPLIESLAKESCGALVLEPSAPGGAVKSRRKGTAWYDLTVTGRPAHAGIEPEKGASAVHEMARLTLKLLTLADPEAGTTLNVGVVSGGTRANVVAAHATAKLDVRFWTREEAERVDNGVRALAPEDPGCALALDGGVDRMPLEQTPSSDRLYQLAREQAAKAGFELGRAATGGASDGNLTSGVGCPTLDGLGPDGGGAHTLDEHVLLADIARRVALLAGLFRRL